MTHRINHMDRSPSLFGEPDESATGIESDAIVASGPRDRLDPRLLAGARIMKSLLAGLVLLPAALGIPLAQAAPQAVVKEVMTKDLPDYAGKEALMIEVTYPPGSEDAPHRHDANAFLYVVEGSIVMQVKGSAPVTLTKGQTFYEGPDDIHVVGRNASATKPAKFVVLLLKNKGAPALTPVH